MLVSSRKAKAETDAALIEGRDRYISSLRAWHKRCAHKQAELEASFDPAAISKYSVNVWDDYPEAEGTYAYVEMNEVPDTVCFDVLLHLLAFAKSTPVIMDMGIDLGLRFYDSSIAYPTLIGRPDGEYSLCKRWELTIAGAGYETLENVVDQLKGAPAFAGKALDIYSES